MQTIVNSWDETWTWRIKKILTLDFRLSHKLRVKNFYRYVQTDFCTNCSSFEVVLDLRNEIFYFLCDSFFNQLGITITMSHEIEPLGTGMAFQSHHVCFFCLSVPWYGCRFNFPEGKPFVDAKFEDLQYVNGVKSYTKGNQCHWKLGIKSQFVSMLNL